MPAWPCPVLQCQLALKAGKFYTSVTNMCVWGNHSTTQVRRRTGRPGAVQAAQVALPPMRRVHVLGFCMLP